MLDWAAYTGLFAIAFAAATILPLQSEAALVALALSGKHSTTALLIVASLGNVAGSTVNWLLGLYLEHFKDKRWFPVSDHALKRAQGWYARFGKWSLLLSWLPIVGDPLTLVAGIMKERLWTFLALVSIAKAGRYLALLATLNAVW